MTEEISDTINAIWSGLGAEGYLYVEDLETRNWIGIKESSRIPLASVAKVPLIAALIQAGERGEIDLQHRVDVDPLNSTPGGTGITVLQDTVTMSLRDLAVMSLSVSDNAATDTIFEIVGPNRVGDLLASNKLRSLTVDSPMSHLYKVIDEIADGNEVEALILATDHFNTSGAPYLPDSAFNTGTARSVARLFELIHTGELIGPKGTATLRKLLKTQVFRHRIASGFPMDAVEYYGKTGTFLNFRHEAGIVIDADSRAAFSIAVFTRSRIAAFSQPELDASIGYCARLAVEHLRSW
ncbi:serine hydrolase [Brevibacterium sp. FAM 25378]|uniref:serine hydrolase n=1 Tax=unclassified Brevibacterium TaxID=2614124 RepID=UPI0010929B85|nr:serine hydrolase [Brevibacterium sp. S22]TGD27620.1 serine hydrolase [Brevibacterium sp. S22]